MNRRSLDQLAAAAGVIGPLLAFIGTGIYFGNLPEPDDDSSEFVKMFTDNRGSMLAGVIVVAIATGLILYWAASIREVFKRDNAESARFSALFYGTALLAFALLLAGFGPVTALAWRGPGDIDPAVVRFVVDTQSLLVNNLSAVPFALFIAAGSAAMLPIAMFPKWLSWLGYLVAIITLVPLFTVSAHTGFVSPYGAIGLVGAVLFFAWIIIASVCLARNTGDAAAAPV